MRGIFYSTIALLFIMPLVLLTFANLAFYQTSTEEKTTKIVGDRLAAYIKSIDDDLPRALNIMAKRAVTETIIYIETNGIPLNDSANVLKELITNGTIYGNKSSIDDFNVVSWAAILKQKGELYGFNTNVKVLDIKFYSINSYNIGVEINLSVNATHPASGMELYRVYNSVVPVQIEGFNDPLYTLKTNGLLKKNIKAPNITVSGVANFDIAVTEGFYMPSPEGPNFLERLEGKTRSSDKYNISNLVTGLESVVYLPVLQANGIPVKGNQTNIDYLYFDVASYSGYQVNQSAYSWLKIDPAHASTYNITTI